MEETRSIISVRIRVDLQKKIANVAQRRQRRFCKPDLYRRRGFESLHWLKNSPIAQSGECFYDMEEVIGSKPIRTTTGSSAVRVAPYIGGWSVVRIHPRQHIADQSRGQTRWAHNPKSLTKDTSGSIPASATKKCRSRING